jgi:hypothetical protein
LLAGHRGEFGEAQRWFRRSIDLFREFGTPFYLARAQLQYAELLGDDADGQPLRDEAAATFETLGAAPWMERARAFRSAVPV